MQLNTLRYMLEIERAGSINKAAESLFISQQGLRKTVGNLEDELGAKLVDRTHSGVEFTCAGRIFLEHARVIVSDIETMVDELQKTKCPTDTSSAVTLWAAPYASINLIGSIYGKLNLPRRASIQEQSNSIILKSIQNGERGRLHLFDWLEDGNGSSSIDAVKSPEVTIAPLFSSRLGIICAKESAVSAYSTISVKKASSVPLVTFSGGDYHDFFRNVMGEFKPRQVELDISNQNAISSFLQQNRESAIIADEFSFTHSKDKKGVAFVPLENPLLLTVGFAYFDDDENLEQYHDYVRDFKKACKRLTTP